jgi:hypothetical protein
MEHPEIALRRRDRRFSKVVRMDAAEQRDFRQRISAEARVYCS